MAAVWKRKAKVSGSGRHASFLAMYAAMTQPLILPMAPPAPDPRKSSAPRAEADRIRTRMRPMEDGYPTIEKNGHQLIPWLK